MPHLHIKCNEISPFVLIVYNDSTCSFVKPVYLQIFSIDKPSSFIIFAVFMIISLDGFSVGTNFSAVLCTFNNIGPGLEAVGPTCNFSNFSPLSKLVLSWAMLAGRLEIFPMLVLLSKNTWIRK